MNRKVAAYTAVYSISALGAAYVALSFILNAWTYAEWHTDGWGRFTIIVFIVADGIVSCIVAGERHG